MSTDILTPLTLAEIEAGAVPMLYYGIIYDTGFDPAEPWYPCGCPYRLEDSHEGDCWLGWIAYPTWMKEPTGDLVIIRSHTGAIAKIVDARPSEPMGEVAIITTADDVIERELGGAAGGWCAPAETLSYCGHPLGADCGCVIESAGEPIDLGDEDETVYFERHHFEPVSSVDDERSDGADVPGEHA